jgi:hypothetical protein
MWHILFVTREAGANVQRGTYNVCYELQNVRSRVGRMPVMSQPLRGRQSYDKNASGTDPVAVSFDGATV